MKNFIFILTLFISLSSCSNFLEVDPKSALAGDNIIIDETSATAALNGVYSALRAYYSVDYQSIAYLSGDNVEWTGSQSQIQEFINHQVRAENTTISNAWVGIYKTINRANGVIAELNKLSATVISPSLKDQILGEAYAIRGLAYFDLVRVWGGVPLILEPTDKVGDNRGIARSSAEETYQQVLDDFNLAEALLRASNNRFRIGKQAVLALKARYYLYHQNWAAALDYANQVLQSIDYELADPYYAFFENNVTGTRESVFELFYNANELNVHRDQWQPQTNGGTRQWAPNAALIALLNNPNTGGARNRLIAKDNQNRWYGNLYYRSPAVDPTYVIRIAELYLIRAEAYAQLNNLALAQIDLNTIRLRAELEAPSLPSQDAVLLAIEEERRLEFAFEAHRWFDLVRTGRAAEVLGINQAFRLRLPIPFSQLLADPVLKQNPGY